MLNILLSGVGGQGTVLAAKVLATAAEQKGWQVRSAETIGMAQRGGSVVSHVRMGNKNERVESCLIANTQADLIIAFEPAEAARVLPYLSPTGTIVTATSAVQAVTSALSGKSYSANLVLANLKNSMNEKQTLVAVDDKALLPDAKSRKALNMVLLARALQAADTGISIDDLKAAMALCVKPQFLEMNIQAIDSAL